jgi:hypothetical protein
VSQESLSVGQSASLLRVENSPRLPFSLRAFLLAPWPVPLACSLMLTLGTPGRGPVLFFFLSLAVELVVSYLGTAALVITLHFVAHARPVTRTVSAITGLVLAGFAYLPFVYINWHASGPDSGPPLDSFPRYLLRNLVDPFFGIFLAAGVVAALVYDILARRQAKQPPIRPVQQASA